MSIDSPIYSWVFDLRASFHTIAHQETTENYVSKIYGKVYLANGEPLDIVDVGGIHLKMSNDFVWKIHKVRHEPKSICNLNLVRQLDDEGHNETFTNSVWNVTKGVMVVM